MRPWQVAGGVVLALVSWWIASQFSGWVGFMGWFAVGTVLLLFLSLHLVIPLYGTPRHVWLRLRYDAPEAGEWVRQCQTLTGQLVAQLDFWALEVGREGVYLEVPREYQGGLTLFLQQNFPGMEVKPLRPAGTALYQYLGYHPDAGTLVAWVASHPERRLRLLVRRDPLSGQQHWVAWVVSQELPTTTVGGRWLARAPGPHPWWRYLPVGVPPLTYLPLPATTSLASARRTSGLRDLVAARVPPPVPGGWFLGATGQGTPVGSLAGEPLVLLAPPLGYLQALLAQRQRPVLAVAPTPGDLPGRFRTIARSWRTDTASSLHPALCVPRETLAEWKREWRAATSAMGVLLEHHSEETHALSEAVLALVLLQRNLARLPTGILHLWELAQDAGLFLSGSLPALERPVLQPLFEEALTPQVRVTLTALGADRAQQLAYHLTMNHWRRALAPLESDLALGALVDTPLHDLGALIERGESWSLATGGNNPGGHLLTHCWLGWIVSLAEERPLPHQLVLVNPPFLFGDQSRWRLWERLWAVTRAGHLALVVVQSDLTCLHHPLTHWLAATSRQYVAFGHSGWGRQVSVPFRWPARARVPLSDLADLPASVAAMWHLSDQDEESILTIQPPSERGALLKGAS